MSQIASINFAPQFIPDPPVATHFPLSVSSDVVIEDSNGLPTWQGRPPTGLYIQNISTSANPCFVTWDNAGNSVAADGIEIGKGSIVYFTFQQQGYKAGAVRVNSVGCDLRIKWEFSY
jgi:hypothetical protein